MPSPGPEPVLVVGGGPAGLVTAAELGRLGIGAIVLEQAEAPGATWRGAYDRLRLNTSRLTSRLAGMPYPHGVGLFPSRSDFVDYLERLVERFGLDVRTGVRVDRIARSERGWRVHTSAGERDAEHVIVATGFANEPSTPNWPGRERFKGALLHSCEYSNPEPFRDRRVLVVGPGCSGMEIANDLVEGGARHVWLAVRTPPNIILRAVGGIPGDVVGIALLRLPPRVGDALDRRARSRLLGDLSQHGLPQPVEGPFTRLRRLRVSPAVVDRDVIEAIRARRLHVTTGVERLEDNRVSLTDGTRVEPDAIIAATGYRCGLERLVGQLGVLDRGGTPRVVGGREAAPGLRFVGYVPVPGQLGRISREARRTARAIASSRR